MFMQSLLANKTQESKLWYEMQNNFYASIQGFYEAELYGNPLYWFKKTWEKITNLSHYKEVTQATSRFKSLGISLFVQ